MKFEIFTIVRNKEMDHLLFEFQARVGISKVLKQNFPELTDEQIENLEKRNARYWNEIAEWLLDIDCCESEEDVIDECFKILGKDSSADVLELTSRALKKKEEKVSKFLNSAVGVKRISKDTMYTLCYLKKMYDCLEPEALPYVDKKVKQKMDERLETLE